MMNQVRQIFKNMLLSVMILGAAGYVLMTTASNAFADDPARANTYCSTDDVQDRTYDNASTCEPPKQCDKDDCLDAAPADGIKRVSGTVGHRDQNYQGGYAVGSTDHKGTDYAASRNSAIYAAGDGQIKRIKYDGAKNKNGAAVGYGNYIMICHPNCTNPTMTTVYAHMNCWASGLGEGDYVKKGQVIGFVGNTGGSTGPHLHVEYRDENYNPLNPLLDNHGGAICTPPEEYTDQGTSNIGGGGGSGGGNGGSGGTNTTGGTSVQPNEHSDKDCNPEIFRKNYVDCLFCNLFKVAFDTSSLIAKKAFDTFAGPIAMLVAVGFGLWLVFTLLKYISTLDKKDPETFIKDLLTRAFVVIIVVTFLNSDSGSFMGMAMEPIFNTGFKLARLTMSGDFTCDKDYGVVGSEGDGGLPASMGNSILCTIEVIQNKLSDVMALGTSAWCVAWNVKDFHGLPHLGYMLSGLGIWVCALILLFIYPFMMLDSVLHLAIAAALLPAAIGAYAFGLTRKYVEKVWETFLKAMFMFVFLTIVLMIIMAAVEEVLEDSITDALRTEVINQGNWEKLLNELSWTGITFLELIFVFILGWAVLGQIAQFAGKFAASLASSNIGQSIGGMAASGAKNLTKKAIAPALGTVAKDVGSGLKSVGAGMINPAKSFITQKYRDYKAQKFMSEGFRERKGIVEGVDENGNKTYTRNTKSWFRRRDKQQTMTMVNGEAVWSTSKKSTTPKWQNELKKTTVDISNTLGRLENQVENKFRSALELDRKEFKEKQFNADQFDKQQSREIYQNMQVQSIRNARGEEVSRDIQFTDPKLKNIYSRGRINVGMLHEARNSNPQLANLVNEAMLTKVMEARMPGAISKNITLRNIKDQGKVATGIDASGNEVMEMVKVENNGTRHIYRMTIKPNGEVTTVYERRSSRHIETLTSTGMVNIKQTKTIDADGNVTRPTISFAFAKHLTQFRTKPAIDYFGHTADYIPSKEKLGLTEWQWQQLVRQYKNNPKNLTISDFAD